MDSVANGVDVGSVNELLFGTSLKIDERRKTCIDTEHNTVHLYLASVSASARCTCCGQVSFEKQCTNFRHPQWMPINGMTTYAHIELNRFRCTNADCPRKTFVEQLEHVRKDQHRSDLVNLVVFAVSVFCSDIVTSLVCGEMGIRISHDSANRLLDKISVEDDPDVEFIGVDDVSLRKGRTYHTVIYDGNDHHLLALLDGRDGTSLKEWLKKHPRVSVVARDRASAYASAITEILPDAMQVADRFHILQNLLGYLKDIFKADIPPRVFIRDGQVLDEPPEKIKVPAVPVDSPAFAGICYDNSPPSDENGEISYCNKQRGDHYSRERLRAARRLEKYERVVSLRNDWAARRYRTKKELAEAYGISGVSAGRYLRMSGEEVERIPEIKEMKKRKTDMDGYMNIVYKMLRDGHRPAFIYSYILHTGYAGSMDSLVNHIRAIALNNFGTKLGRGFQYGEGYPEDVAIVRRSDILKYITIKDRDKMADTDVAAHYDAIEEKYPAVKLCAQIWNDFHPILMGSDPDKLDTFLESYSDSAIAPFINGIKMDIAPVKNAISTPYSSGFVEGGNCRYKSTKRLMFGRSGINHLFLKTYATSIIMRTGKKASSLIEKWINS